MKLNLHVLKEDLKYWSPSVHLIDAPLDILCTRHELHSRFPNHLYSDIIYILPASALKNKPGKSEEHMSIVCLGTPPAIWLSFECNLLYIEENIMLEDLNNAITNSFYYYNKWELSLQEILDNHLPLQEFAIRSRELIPNHFGASNSSYEVLFDYFPKAKSKNSLYEKYQKETKIVLNEFLSNDDITTLISDPDYYRVMGDKDPVIYPGVPYGFRSLSYNFRLNGISQGWIIIDEILEPLTGRDFVIIKILGDFVAKSFLIQKRYPVQFKNLIEPILKDLLEHHLIPEDKIKNALDLYDWKIKDQYFCIVCKLNTRIYSENTLEALALNLSQASGNSCYTIFKGKIILIYNLSKQAQKREIALSAILPILRDNLLKAGISVIYNDFKNLYSYFNQASISITVGEKKNPSFWYFRFEDYHMEYLIYKYTEKIIPEALIPSGLQILIDYDKVKNSEYVYLLSLYLKYDRNATETAHAAYLHRNTFNYRLKRIKELSHLDLNDSDTCLLLKLSLKLLEI